jgi:hypothetical protein
MHVNIGRASLVAGSLLLSAGPALAASAATCTAYAKETVAKAKGVGQFACGYDLKDPRWIAEPKGHERWCRSAPEDAVARQTSYRRGEMKLCLQCRAYATRAVEFAAENGKRNCGFSGPRWSSDEQAHFGWCMTMRGNEGAIADVVAADQLMTEKTGTSARSETIDRIMQIATCKSR